MYVSLEKAIKYYELCYKNLSTNLCRKWSDIDYGRKSWCTFALNWLRRTSRKYYLHSGDDEVGRPKGPTIGIQVRLGDSDWLGPCYWFTQRDDGDWDYWTLTVGSWFEPEEYTHPPRNLRESLRKCLDQGLTRSDDNWRPWTVVAN